MEIEFVANSPLSLRFGRSAYDFGRRAYGFDRRAYDFGRRAYDFGRCAYGFGRRAYGFGRRAYSFGRRAYGFGRRAYGFGRSAYGFDRRAYGFGRRAYEFCRSAYDFDRRAYELGRSAYDFGRRAYGFDKRACYFDLFRKPCQENVPDIFIFRNINTPLMTLDEIKALSIQDGILSDSGLQQKLIDLKSKHCSILMCILYVVTNQNCSLHEARIYVLNSFAWVSEQYDFDSFQEQMHNEFIEAATENPDEIEMTISPEKTTFRLKS